VLSSAADRTRARVSSAPASLTITFSRAEELIPPMNATGAAMSRGQGVATTSTSANRVGSPLTYQATPAMVSDTIVNGTAYRSAKRTIGARDSTASDTRRTIEA